MATEHKAGFDFSKKQTLEDVDFTHKRVLARVDYNVPLKGGVITDTARVDTTLPTLQYILSKPIRCLVLMAHLGRPILGEKKETLAPVAKYLGEKLKALNGSTVTFLHDCVGPEVEKAINEANPNSQSPAPVFLLENVRFHAEEEGKGIKLVEGKETTVKAKPEEIEAFRKGLTNLGDVFVFDAFGAAHRAHSSVVGVNLPQRVAGRLMEKELTFFTKILHSPQRPLLAILGGAKVSDKIGVIENLLNLVDEIVIAGGMAYTFKKVAQGVKIGSSKFDKEGADKVEAIMKKAKERNVKITLPIDHIIADKFAADAHIGLTDDATGIPDGWMGLDVGPRSIAEISAAIQRAKTVFWNGPLGVFEMAPFAAGTLAALSELVHATKKGTVTVVGGGDSGAAAQVFYFGDKPAADQLTHISTGGGASLELVEGKVLPGVAALSDKK